MYLAKTETSASSTPKNQFLILFNFIFIYICILFVGQLPAWALPASSSSPSSSSVSLSISLSVSVSAYEEVNACAAGSEKLARHDKIRQRKLSNSYYLADRRIKYAVKLLFFPTDHDAERGRWSLNGRGSCRWFTKWVWDCIAHSDCVLNLVFYLA